MAFSAAITSFFSHSQGADDAFTTKVIIIYIEKAYAGLSMLCRFSSSWFNAAFQATLRRRLVGLIAAPQSRPPWYRSPRRWLARWVITNAQPPPSPVCHAAASSVYGHWRSFSADAGRTYNSLSRANIIGQYSTAAFPSIASLSSRYRAIRLPHGRQAISSLAYFTILSREPFELRAEDIPKCFSQRAGRQFVADDFCWLEVGHRLTESMLTPFTYMQCHRSDY